MEPSPPKVATPPSSSSSGDSSDSDEDQTAPKPLPSQTLTTKEDSSDEEDDEDASSSEEDDDEDAEDDAAESVNPTPSKPASISESGSGSDSESDAPPALMVTPLNSRPMEPSPRSNDTEKKSLQPFFQRLFSLEDDIAILKGLAEYQQNNGLVKVTTAAIPHFRALFGKFLSVEVSDAKLYDKIRKMKSKYDARCKKGGGKFAREHDKVVYGLSKKVWGEVSGGESSKKRKKAIPKKKKKAKKKKRARLRECSGKGAEYPYLYQSAVRMGNLAGVEAVDRVDSEKARDLEKKLRKVVWMEVEHRAERMGLFMKSFELIAGGMERSDS